MELTGSNGTFPWLVSSGQSHSVVKKTLPTPVSPVTTGQDTERDFTTYLPLICFLNTLVQFPWTDILFRSFGATVVCAACIPCFFLALSLPVSHTVSLSQVCAGHINGSNCGGTRPAVGALDLLWLSFWASVYLPGSGISSHNVVFQSDAVTFNFNIFLTFLTVLLSLRCQGDL